MQNISYVALTRCSTEEQRKKGASHESQLREITQNSRFENFECAKAFHETVSGWQNVERGTLDEIYQFCLQNPNVRFLIIQKWDRFYRNSLKALDWIDRFKKINVEVNAAEQWINYSGGSINTILGIYIGMAADESHNTSMRVKDRNRVWQEKGYWLHDVPLGYIRDLNSKDENGKTKIIIDTETSYFIKLVFDLLQQQVLEPHEIRKAVKKEGYDISSSAFYRMIANIFYAGHLKLKAYKKQEAKIIKSRYPAYITLEQFEINQNYLAEIKQKGGRKVKTNNQESVDLFPLKGHIKCNECGKNLTASKSKGKKQKYGYYHHNRCFVRIPSKAAESVINSILKDFELSDEYYYSLQAKVNDNIKVMTSDLRNKTAPIAAAITKSETRLSNLKYLLTDGDIQIDEYRNIKSSIEKEITNKKIELNRIHEQLEGINDKASEVLKLLNNLNGIYKNIDNQNKRLLLRTIFPEGFTIIAEKKGETTNYKCRTPKINELISILCLKSDSYDAQKKGLLEVIPCRTRHDATIEHETSVIDMFDAWIPLLNNIKIA